jgi:hypothetical protein
MGSAELGVQSTNKSQPAMAKSRLMIALHSPYPLLETGLHMCRTEKSQISGPFTAEQSVLRSPVCLRIIAKKGMFRQFSGNGWRNFSAVKTCWRSEWDSNLRYPFEFRKSRRLRNLHAVKNLTRESTAA